jgi:hypothetical protein
MMATKTARAKPQSKTTNMPPIASRFYTMINNIEYKKEKRENKRK